MKTLPLAALLLAPLLIGCATGPLMEGVPGDVRPSPRVSGPKRSATEPAFCVVSIESPAGELGMFTNFAGFWGSEFRSIKRVSAKKPDASGCEVLLRLRHPGFTVFALDSVEAYSAYDGRGLWMAQSTGAPAVLGMTRLRGNLRMAFLPGGPAARRLAESKATGAAMTQTQIIEFSEGRAPALAAAAPRPVPLAGAAVPATAPVALAKAPPAAPAELAEGPAPTTAAHHALVRLSLAQAEAELLP